MSVKMVATKANADLPELIFPMPLLGKDLAAALRPFRAMNASSPRVRQSAAFVGGWQKLFASHHPPVSLASLQTFPPNIDKSNDKS
jgi:hypothetical protein